MKKICFLLSICFFFLLNGFSFATTEVRINVTHVVQCDPTTGLGTSWTKTKICGPASMLMVAAKIYNFNPSKVQLKKIVDWMVVNKIYKDANNYNGYNTVSKNIKAISSYYYGIWDTAWHYPKSFGSYNSHFNKIREQLDAGRPVIIGTYTDLEVIFSKDVPTNGHFMVLDGLRDNNDDGVWDEVHVTDPGHSTENSKYSKWYSVSSLTKTYYSEAGMGVPAWQGTLFFYSHLKVGKYANDTWRDYYVQKDNKTLEASPYSQPFVDYYINAGIPKNDKISPRGPDIFGYPNNYIRLWPSYHVNNYNLISQAWVQDYYNKKADEWYTMVLNSCIKGYGNSYIGVVFSVHGHMRDFWGIYFWTTGYPICNEYFETVNGTIYVVQWFRDGVGNYNRVTYNTKTGTYNDSATNNLPIGDHENYSIEVNAGFSENGYGMGGGEVLIPPYNIQSSALSDSQIQLTWTLPNGTEGYNVKFYEANSSKVVKNIPATDSVIIDRLLAGSEYCYQLSLVNNSTGEESAKSEVVCAETDISSGGTSSDWSVETHIFASGIGTTEPYNPTSETYSYEKTSTVYANSWVKLSSTNPDLSFTWKLYYNYDDSPYHDATQSGAGGAYLCTNHSYYNATNAEYTIWHSIEVNSLAYVGQYRVELWIDGVKASVRNFDVTLPQPDYFSLNGDVTSTSVPLRWNYLGDSTEGSGVELFLDNDLIAFIAGSSTGYTDTNPNTEGNHVYRIREVIKSYSGTFRSPFSEPLEVEIPTETSNCGTIPSAVTGVGCTIGTAQ